MRSPHLLLHCPHYALMSQFHQTNDFFFTVNHTCNENRKDITQIRIHDKWKTNPKRNIEKYSSRNAEAKVDKLGAQKWTNWGRSEIGSSFDLKLLAQVLTVPRPSPHAAESKYVCHVGGYQPHFSARSLQS